MMEKIEPTVEEEAPPPPETVEEAPATPPETDEQEAAPETVIPQKRIMIPKERLDQQTAKTRDLAAQLEQERLEKRMLYEKIFQKDEPPPPSIPNPDDDPIGYTKVLGQATVELGHDLQAIKRQMELQSTVRAALPAAAAKLNPENPNAAAEELVAAANHAFQARVAFHSHLGPERANALAREEELSFIEDCRKRQLDPYLTAHAVAKSLGFAPPAPPAVPDAALRDRARKETGGLPKGGAATEYGTIDVSDYDKYCHEQKKFFDKNPHLTGERAMSAWVDYATKHGRHK